MNSVVSAFLLGLLALGDEAEKRRKEVALVSRWAPIWSVDRERSRRRAT